jgi:hypothetical protein
MACRCAQREHNNGEKLVLAPSASCCVIHCIYMQTSRQTLP